MEAVMDEIKIERYPAYKDLGVDWLGEIPEHWEVKKLKELCIFINRGITPAYVEASNSRIINQATFSRGYLDVNNAKFTIDNTNQISSDKGKVVNKDILLASTGGGVLGKVAFFSLNEDCFYADSHVTIIRFDKSLFESKYFYYFFSINYDLINGILAQGSTNQTELQREWLRQLLMPVPFHAEQTAIANFLDRKTAQIDKAIAQKEKLIELLKERRQILIHNAVTRGLNPDVPMKDSGVVWIGEIPEHWMVKALKHIAFLQSGETISAESFTEEGYPVYGGNGFRGYTERYTNDGDFVLIGRQGALCGNVNYANGKFFASEHAIVVYPLNKENVKWLGETIREADFNRLSQSAAQPGIAVNVVKNVLFPYPPLLEQTVIADFMNAQSQKVEKAISLKRKEIEKLKEYKATLINAAVTGKLKVS